jgi:hypothetical protein
MNDKSGHSTREQWPLPQDPKDYCPTCDGIHDRDRHQRLMDMFYRSGSYDCPECGTDTAFGHDRSCAVVHRPPAV